MTNTYDTENSEYIFEVQGDIHDDIKRVFNVLDELGIGGDVAHNLLGHNVEVDPIHLCRMANRGLFNKSEYIPGEILHLVNLEYLTPVYDGDEHIGELGIHLATNNLAAYRYDQIGDVDEEEYTEERVENLTRHGQLLKENIVDTVKDYEGVEAKQKTVEIIDEFVQYYLVK